MKIVTKNSKYQISNNKQFPNSKHPPPLNPLPTGERKVWDFGYLNLSFDWAQDGELAEPFAIL